MRFWKEITSFALAGAGALFAGTAIGEAKSAPPKQEVQRETKVQEKFKESPQRRSKIREEQFHSAIKKADKVVKRFKEEGGLPGISVGVSVNGDVVWKTGYGYADVENLIPCNGDAVMRIASISKSVTMTLVAKLMQDGLLDLDAPVQKYVPSFPEKNSGW